MLFDWNAIFENSFLTLSALSPDIPNARPNLTVLSWADKANSTNWEKPLTNPPTIGNAIAGSNKLENADLITDLAPTPATCQNPKILENAELTTFKPFCSSVNFLAFKDIAE